MSPEIETLNNLKDFLINNSIILEKINELNSNLLNILQLNSDTMIN